jgi:lactate permease
LPLLDLSANAGRLVAPLSTFVPMYLILVMGGVKELRRVWPAALVCGVSFGIVQFIISNYSGPYLTDILAAFGSIGAVVLLLRFWQPRAIEAKPESRLARYSTREILLAWSPYLFLVLFVLLWSLPAVKSVLNSVTFSVAWPGLHNLVQQLPPVVGAARPYAAMYKVDWLAASGSSCALSVLVTAFVLRISPRRLFGLCSAALRQLFAALGSFVFVLALAFLMNYCGATATLGLAFSNAGAAFPFFSALLGWLGVFLTGSDTSANALFGNLQHVTAVKLGLKPTLLAASNSAGGVMGKMISLQSIAVAAAATHLASTDEPKLFRFTLKHSVFLATLVGFLTLFYAYVAPGWTR